MSRWFRHYAGMARDEKLVSAAIKSKQTIERVVWIWCAILESAAEIDDNGRYAIDHDEIAYFLRADAADIRAVEDALAVSGRVDSGAVVKWGNRQFKSDKSAERVAAHRERKRSEGIDGNAANLSQNGDVTLQKRHCNPPETELETETDKETSSLRSEVARDARRPAKVKGSRLPSDWQPSEADLAMAAGEGFSPFETRRMADGFRDYWLAKAGSDGVKLDWPATWRGWVRRERDRKPTHRQTGPPQDRPLRGSAAIVEALKRMDKPHDPERSPASPAFQLPAS
jgi:hypothetical protein